MNKILITGGTGMIGNALKEVLPNAIYLSSKDVNLINQKESEEYFDFVRPDKVIHLAARVGGIKANMDNLADFFYENIMINTNVLECSRKFKVKKVLSLMSTCVYPDKIQYPLVEDKMHYGPPHDSNYGYAYAKRMLDVQSRTYRDQYGCNFITAIPNNLFGEYDNFDLNDSHVVAAIIRKVFDAKKNKTNVVLWGDGEVYREFTYSKDLAEILVFLLDNYNERFPINIGNPEEYLVKDLAKLISDVYEFEGEIIWDTTKPKGQHRKPSDNSLLKKIGWTKYTDFRSAIEKTCLWFEQNYDIAKGVK